MKGLPIMRCLLLKVIGKAKIEDKKCYHQRVSNHTKVLISWSWVNMNANLLIFLTMGGFDFSKNFKLSYTFDIRISGQNRTIPEDNIERFNRIDWRELMINASHMKNYQKKTSIRLQCTTNRSTYSTKRKIQ